MGASFSRRDLLAGSAALAAGGLGARSSSAAEPVLLPESRFTLGLNTSTLRGHKLPIAKVVEIAAAAGYKALEPWIDELEAHEKAGGSLRDLAKKIADLGMKVVSAIGFAEWAVEDEERRKKGLENLRRDMDKVRAVGGERIAAPPTGLTDRTDADLLAVADRYRAILEIGAGLGVIPQVEVWGFSKTLARLGEAALVAIESGHPMACILPDVYHLYKGGSTPGGLRLLNGGHIHVFHMNDYPAQPARAEITDAHRVFPGDGVAPLKAILADLQAIGFRGTLSLELFNKDYWAMDPAEVARTGLRKMQAAAATIA